MDLVQIGSMQITPDEANQMLTKLVIFGAVALGAIAIMVYSATKRR